MLIFEIKKLVKQPQISVLLIVCFLFPAVYFAMQLGLGGDWGSFSPSAYTKLYQDIDLSDPAGEAQRLRETQEMIIYSGGMPDRCYTDSIRSEYALYETVAAELEQTADYPDYIFKTLQECLRYSAVGLFQTDQTLVKNAERTYQDYSRLVDVAVSAVPAYGLYRFFETNAAELSVILAVFLIISVLVTAEIEDGTICLMRCCAKGRMHNAYVKYAAGLLMVLSCWIFLFGAKLLLTFCFYGIPDLALSIQSVYGCMDCALRISIGEALALFFLMKALSYTWLYTLAFLAALFLKRSGRFLGIGMALFGGSWFAYERIASTSHLAFLKWFNPAAILHVDQLLFSYKNFVLFGFAASYLELSLAVFIGSILPTLIFIGLRFCTLQSGGKDISGTFFYRFESLFVAFTGKRSMFGAEFRKWGFYQNGLCVCIAVLLLVLNVRITLSRQLYDTADIYYKHYVQEMQGVYSDEKLGTLYQYDQELQELEEELLLYPENYSDDILSYYQKELNKADGLRLTISYGEYLKEKPGSSFVYERGYLVLFGQEQGAFPLRMYRIIAAVLMTMLSSLLLGIEKRTGMERLIMISTIGTKKVGWAKCSNVLLIGVIVFAVIYLPWIGQVFDVFEMSQLSAPAYSLECFSAVPRSVTLLGVISLFYLLHLFYLWVVGFVAAVLGQRMKNDPAAVLASIGIALFPIILTK